MTRRSNLVGKFISDLWDAKFFTAKKLLVEPGSNKHWLGFVDFTISDSSNLEPQSAAEEEFDGKTSYACQNMHSTFNVLIFYVQKFNRHDCMIDVLGILKHRFLSLMVIGTMCLICVYMGFSDVLQATLI